MTEPSTEPAARAAARRPGGADGGFAVATGTYVPIAGPPDGGGRGPVPTAPDDTNFAAHARAVGGDDRSPGPSGRFLRRVRGALRGLTAGTQGAPAPGRWVAACPDQALVLTRLR